MLIRACLAALVLSAGAALAQPLPNGIAAGDTTQTSTILWARASTPGDVRFELFADADLHTLLASASVAVTDTLAPAKQGFEGLAPATRYYTRATDAAGLSATGTLVTPADLSAGFDGFRMGVTGDWRGELAPYPGARNAPARNLDLWVSHGDTIYADYPSPAVPLDQCVTLADYRAKHAETYTARFGLNTLADIRASASLLATIDDHEVTNDFAGGASPASDPRFAGDPGLFINETALYANGLQAFGDYHPTAHETYAISGSDPRTDGKTRLYRSRSYGRDAAVIVLDERSFRDQELPPANPLDQNSVVQFILGSFNPARTMLGRPQLQDLCGDLAKAQADGITWKFVLIPEPIQNLGVLAASDRYEGYAAERSLVLDFVRSHGIKNVVFVSADIHGTLVNNLTYQTAPFGPQIESGAFDISVGSLAFDAPFGPTVAGIAAALNLPGALPLNVYNALPLAQREAYITALMNQQLSPLGYTTIGLDGSPIDATLLQGGYTATNTYGWTEFDVQQGTQDLTVTTYGIDWYTQDQLLANPADITGRQPQIVSQFVVRPQRCATDFNHDNFVDMFDYAAFVECYESGACGENANDFNHDGFTDFFDYDAFVTALENGDC